VNILILGGTSDARSVLEKLKHLYKNIKIFFTVATEYGYNFYKDLEKGSNVEVILVRFDHELMRRFIIKNEISEVYDATHPYAKIITDIAIDICNQLGVNYYNIKREIDIVFEYDLVYTFNSYAEAVEFVIKNRLKPVLITTGSKNAKEFADIADFSYIRILPFENSLKEVTSFGFKTNRIIAMQGPFSMEFNYVLIKDLGIKFLITKNSGTRGGVIEKMEACKKANIPIGVIL